MSAELHRLALQMPSTHHASITVKQVLVQASSSSGSSSKGDGSSSGTKMVPILQIPATDMQAHVPQSYTRFGSPKQPQQAPPVQPFAAGAPEASDGDAGAAASPKPSTLGRIYHESPLSSYISHIQVCAYKIAW